MKFQVTSLLVLLSATILISSPALSMQAEDLERKIISLKVKAPTTREKISLKEFLSQKDYAGAFTATKAGLPHVSDAEIVNFLMTSNKYPGWDKVDPTDKAWVVTKVTKAATRKNLVSFLSQKDYAGAFTATKAGLPHVSDAEIVNFLMTSNKYPGWDKVDPDTKRWVVNVVVSKAKQQELEKILRSRELRRTYFNIKDFGLVPSDRDILELVLENEGYSGWKDLTPVLQDWAVTEVNRGFTGPLVDEVKRPEKAVREMPKLPAGIDAVVSKYNELRDCENDVSPQILVNYLAGMHIDNWAMFSEPAKAEFVMAVVSKTRQHKFIVKRKSVLSKIKKIVTYGKKQSEIQASFEEIARDPEVAYCILFIRKELERNIKFNPLLTIKTPKEIEKMFSMLALKQSKLYAHKLGKVSKTLASIRENVIIGVGTQHIKSTDFLLEVATLLAHLTLKSSFRFELTRNLFLGDLEILEDPSPAALVGSMLETYLDASWNLLNGDQ
ncbi:MAG: hypothetical protein JSR85_04845 [Proteobacteria bacterium]|nr:hypothetical protein [Pseudomonadota bacterium]